MGCVERTPARAWLVWGVAVLAYTIGVLQRTSLGVAGLDAAARFEISAGVLGTFAVVQLLVYAAMQVPVGLLLDRVGPRVMVATGAALMAVGQLSLALANTFPTAILARVLVGAGDAMTFISVLRVVAAWFPARQVPVLTQLTGLVGQTGQILSVIPLVALLHGTGWTPAFLSAASLSVLAVILTLALVRDSPDGSVSDEVSPSWAQVRHDLVEVWVHPGTRLGLWTHFTTQFSSTVFLMLWGYPFLIAGEGLTRQSAGALFTILTVSGMIAGPVIGVLVSRHPLRRSWLVLGIVLSTMGIWTIVLLLPGPAPWWLLLVLVLVLSVCGPGSLIGFDYARTFNPPHRFGTATGIVNVGGFVAALLTILLVGLVLDAVGQGTTYTLAGFRVALSVQYLFWFVGLAGFLRARSRVRARMAASGQHVPPLREVLRNRRAAPGSRS
jgi:MFS family permease